MSQIAPCSLQGLRILIAEDNYLIGESIRQILMDMECTVIGPIDDLDEVLGAIRSTEIDGALLDVQLGDVSIHPAASELARRGIPFILATGCENVARLPVLLAQAPLLNKPFEAAQLERIVSRTFRPCVKI